eukprot:CAMPEP_0172495564 /NCGR_PEP_ID=MMETSP1066-20121228/71478_1 /TAXON_ID=671091 /ORGANISM="Coscinodiscus wailesii, Strain CCMP2513" /LENGTH=164 /DNA_ID=CAMNT_0013267315 /DNA_START=38 /DNA_END=529 /DNA_ORIENTATION=-
MTGIAFSSMYPRCIAESPLFREKRAWFREYFPIFMKFISGGFVSEHEAGQRLFQVVRDPRCVKSGVYWGWNDGPREGSDAKAIEKGGLENDMSSKVLNSDTTYTLFTSATRITGAEWPYEQSKHYHPHPNLESDKLMEDDIATLAWKDSNNKEFDIDAAVSLFD